MCINLREVQLETDIMALQSLEITTQLTSQLSRVHYERLFNNDLDIAGVM